MHTYRHIYIIYIYIQTEHFIKGSKSCLLLILFCILVFSLQMKFPSTTLKIEQNKHKGSRSSFCEEIQNCTCPSLCSLVPETPQWLPDNYTCSWHPLTCFTSMVCAWCIALIAVCAMALVVKVTNAQPGERTKRNQVVHYLHNYWDEYRNENAYWVGRRCRWESQKKLKCQAELQKAASSILKLPKKLLALLTSAQAIRAP